MPKGRRRQGDQRGMGQLADRLKPAASVKGVEQQDWRVTINWGWVGWPDRFGDKL